MTVINTNTGSLYAQQAMTTNARSLATVMQQLSTGKRINNAVDDVAGLAAAALQGLAELVALYDNEATAYRAVRRPGYRYDYDDYAHLARVAEWSAHTDDEGGA